MYKLFTVLVFAILTFSSCKPSLKEDEYLIRNMLQQEPGQFQSILQNQDSLEVQIIYTQINRDANNRPEFKSFYFNVDPQCYFYPASTVKLPVVLMAMEKLKQLNIPNLTRTTTMFNDSAYCGQITVHEDSTSLSCVPSIGHYTKKIFVVSDNDAHNRLYEFLGQKAANATMETKGYAIRLLSRLDRALSPDENRHTEAVSFLYNDTVIFSQPMLENDSIPVREKIMKGIGYIDNDDELILSPMDFSYKNSFPLVAQQNVLRALIFPASVPAEQRFDMRDDDRKFILKYMSQLPTETFIPDYADDSIYYPAYAKYLLYGNDIKEIPGHIRIFNKIGNAYGYLIDNAYIVDFDNHVEFMLSAVIATNTDQIYNDEKYEYETIGFPFMKNLGRLIYNYELAREKKFTADLSEFRMDYDRREE